VDLLEKLPGNIMKRLSDTASKTAWQTRVKALEEVSNGLESANYAIMLNKASADLLRVINDRCMESNVNVKKAALPTTKLFLSSVDASKRHKIGRIIVEGVMHNFADKKEVIRKSAIEAMKSFVSGEEEGSVMAACFLACFKSINAVLAMPAFRSAVLRWLQYCFDANSGISTLTKELVPLVPPLIACLTDRTSAIRNQAEKILTIIHTAAPKKCEIAIKKVVQDLKPAEQRAVQAAINNIKASSRSSSNTSNKVAKKKWSCGCAVQSKSQHRKVE
jgi:hypothetical protein